MIIVDTGFLYALVDARDVWHERALAQAGTAVQGWVTTWPVLTEATHLMTRRLGASFAAALMDDAADGGFQVWAPPPEQVARIPALMRRYANLPMDLADASLVLLAEHLGHGRILSTDQRDFRSYRFKNRQPLSNRLGTTP